MQAPLEPQSSNLAASIPDPAQVMHEAAGLIAKARDLLLKHPDLPASEPAILLRCVAVALFRVAVVVERGAMLPYPERFGAWITDCAFAAGMCYEQIEAGQNPGEHLAPLVERVRIIAEGMSDVSRAKLMAAQAHSELLN